jgi:hypothetical protein
MSGTALEHPLVRGYLRDLDAALRGLPAAQALELREQITAHLDDSLGPDAGDQEVAATLSQLGSPAGLAAEAGAPDGLSGPQAALGRVENDQSVQRAILYAALSARPPVLASEDLMSLQQAVIRESTDLTDFNVSANTAEQELYSKTVSGQLVDIASSDEILAEQRAATSPRKPLTGATGLDAAAWYRDKSITIRDTRTVTGQLTSQISGRANALKSTAARNLLLISIATGVLLLLLLISAVLARPRKQGAGHAPTRR